MKIIKIIKMSFKIEVYKIYLKNRKIIIKVSGKNKKIKA